MANRIGDLVVKPRSSPLLRYALIAAGAVVAVAAGAGLFWRGESVAGFDSSAAGREVAADRAEIGHLRRQVANLDSRLAMSERLLQANRAAYAALSAALKESDKKTMSLREKLGFYQTILQSPQKNAGLKIDRFHVKPAGKAWHYRLVLTEPFALNQWVYADIRLTVQGEEGGHSSDVSYPSLVDTPLTVHFKYFDDMRGHFVLPSGFVARRVIVQIASGGHTLRGSYAWPAVGPSGSRK